MKQEAIQLKENDDDFDILVHYGTKRHSGRYPWGSGKDPYQHTRDLLARVDILKKKGWTETPENIMKEFGLTTTQYRAQKAMATNLRRIDRVYRAKSLAEDGKGASEIARIMSEETGKKINESTVRSWMNEDSERRMLAAKHTADFIRNQIKEKGIVDVSSGVEAQLGISKDKLKEALAILSSEGYVVLSGGIPQPTNKGQQTNTKVIGPKGTKPSDFYDFQTGEVNIKPLVDYVSKDNGDTFEKKWTYPESLDSKRVKIRYAEEGGIDKDGVVELRPGVDDLSLNGNNYAQVRIMVDGSHYIKGMAVYGDAKDFPPGVDAIFNTNKHEGTPMLGPKDNTVLKNIKSDPENPFGSTIKDADQGGQYWYTDKDGNKKLGLINKARDEGDWQEWQDNVPAQFLSKQSVQLAKQQLNLAIADKKEEYDSIMAIDNPVIRKQFLYKFAEECDSSAVNLKAAALPGQKYHVILPLTDMKDNQVYAPGYKEGSQVALVRYPHQGIFEIPILTVTKSKKGDKMIGPESIDAIGINKKVADRLSGADFDGDTVMVIPLNDKIKIKTSSNLKELEGFDPKETYKIPSGDTTTKRMQDTQKQMGVISNLITDMTIQGASTDEIARATKHALVVIDAEKHGLDYKRSEMDNGIQELKDKYQGGGGASTLLSKSKGEHPVLKRQGSPKINIKGADWYDPDRPEGALVYKVADDVEYTYDKVNPRTGEVTKVTKTRTQKSTQMAETDDANTLMSSLKTPMERTYANYANTLKSMANQARVEYVNTPKVAVNMTAKKQYKNEVSSLLTKLAEAEKNKPKERAALVIANAEVAKRKNEVTEKVKAEHPNATKKEIKKYVKKEFDEKKASQQAVTKARQQVGSVARKNRNIKITDKEWEAIQANAITESTLTRILNNSDMDSLRQRATPRTTKTISSSKKSRVKSLKSSGYTIAEIAEHTGLTPSQVNSILNPKEE